MEISHTSPTLRSASEEKSKWKIDDFDMLEMLGGYRLSPIYSRSPQELS